MANKGYRQGRLGEEIRKVIGEMLLRDIKDPRLSGFVSISSVMVTRDGSYATCYVTVLGSSIDNEPSAEEKAEVIEAFQSAKGLIKREIGNLIKVRHVPELIFKLDTSMEYGRKMSKIMDGLGLEKEKDE